jgi:AcrR family transcriptional regulator
MTKKNSPTKDKILQSTRLLLSTHGFENTTIEDILTTAGITKGAFYHHFKNKESLCEAVLEQVIEDFNELARQLDESLSPIEQLDSFISKILYLNSAGQWVNCNLMLKLSSEPLESHLPIKEILSNFWHWYTNFYRELLIKCREQNLISKTFSLEMQIQIILSMLAGSILIKPVNNEIPNYKEIASAIIKMISN